MVKKLFKCQYYLLVLILVLVFVFLNYILNVSQECLEIFNPVFCSVSASFLVGIYFQYKIKGEISDEHLKIMEFQQEYHSSGIIKYYSSFKDCEQDLRNDLLKTTKAQSPKIHRPQRSQTQQNPALSTCQIPNRSSAAAFYN